MKKLLILSILIALSGCSLFKGKERTVTIFAKSPVICDASPSTTPLEVKYYNYDYIEIEGVAYYLLTVDEAFAATQLLSDLNLHILELNEIITYQAQCILDHNADTRST